MELFKSGNDLIYSEYQGEYFDRGDCNFVYCEYIDDYVLRFNTVYCQITKEHFLREDTLEIKSGVYVFKKLAEKCTHCNIYRLKTSIVNGICSHCIISN